MLFRFQHWWRTRLLEIERRKLFKPIAAHDRRIFKEKGWTAELYEPHEEEDTLEKLDRGLIIMKWLELRSRAADLGVFVDWSDTKALDLVAIGEYDQIRKEMSELRLAIRKERNERWQFWELKLKVLTQLAIALTGVIGAAIGLIATLKR